MMKNQTCAICENGADMLKLCIVLQFNIDYLD